MLTEIKKLAKDVADSTTTCIACAKPAFGSNSTMISCLHKDSNKLVLNPVKISEINLLVLRLLT